MIPNLAPGSSRDDEKKLMEEMKGKPTASVMSISYAMKTIWCDP